MEVRLTLVRSRQVLGIFAQQKGFHVDDGGAATASAEQRPTPVADIDDEAQDTRAARPSAVMSRRSSALDDVEPQTGSRLRSVLWLLFVVVLAVGLGAAGWWTGHHYLGIR